MICPGQVHNPQLQQIVLISGYKTRSMNTRRKIMEHELIKEGYLSIQEWGKWLVTIESAVCAGLWPKLSATPRPPNSLYLGWMMFIGSILTTAIMLSLVSFFIQRAHLNYEQDRKLVKILVFIQFAFFLGGLICFGTRVFSLWFGV